MSHSRKRIAGASLSASASTASKSRGFAAGLNAKPVQGGSGHSFFGLPDHAGVGVAGQVVVQRQVRINGPAVFETPDGNFRYDGADMALNGAEAALAQDDPIRRYNSEAEFRDHANGQPVSVGLGGTPPKWYRIDYLPPSPQAEFFVLGEKHKDLNYRRLLADSNQVGNVLGEGGMNSNQAMQPGHALEPDPPAGPIANPPAFNEFTAENLIAKAYFPAANHQRALDANNFQQPTIGQLDRVRRSRALLDSRFVRLRDRIAGYENGRFMESLSPSIQAYDQQRALPLNDGPAIAAEKAAIDALVLVLIDAAWQEDSLGDTDRADERGLERATSRIEQRRTAGSTPNMHVAAYYRNQAMYQAIKKAKTATNFVMAGLGDHHVEALESFLTPIPVIRYQEFVDGTHAAVEVSDPDRE